MVKFGGPSSHSLFREDCSRAKLEEHAKHVSYKREKLLQYYVLAAATTQPSSYGLFVREFGKLRALNSQQPQHLCEGPYIPPVSISCSIFFSI